MNEIMNTNTKGPLSGGFFKQISKQKVEFGLVYEADIPENELQNRRFPDGNQILNEMRVIFKLPPSVISGMIPLLNVRGMDSFVMTCTDQATMEEALRKMPSVMVDGKLFLGRLADPDCYTYKPKRVKVFIYGAPPTMSEEAIISKLSTFGDLESGIDFDFYEPPWERVAHGNRYTFFKNIFSSAGLPPVIWVSGIRLKLRHREDKNVTTMSARNSRLVTSTVLIRHWRAEAELKSNQTLPYKSQVKGTHHYNPRPSLRIR